MCSCQSTVWYALLHIAYFLFCFVKQLSLKFSGLLLFKDFPSVCNHKSNFSFLFCWRTVIGGTKNKHFWHIQTTSLSLCKVFCTLMKNADTQVRGYSIVTMNVSLMLCILTSFWVLFILNLLQWFHAWNQEKMSQNERVKKVFRPAFGCVQHLKAGQNTQHLSIKSFKIKICYIYIFQNYFQAYSPTIDIKSIFEFVGGGGGRGGEKEF